MGHDMRGALELLAREAHRLSAICSALDVLHESTPATVHPDADALQQRATDALPVVIEDAIRRADEIASRLDHLAAAASRAARDTTNPENEGDHA